MEPPQEVRTGCGTWWMAGIAVRRTSLQPGGTVSVTRVVADPQVLTISRSRRCSVADDHHPPITVTGTELWILLPSPSWP